MNTFNVSKRCIWSYEEFLKDKKKASDAKHIEKGEADIVKDAMDGEKEGKKGIATLSEGLGEDKYKILNKFAVEYYLKTSYEIDVDDVIETVYDEMKEAVVGVLTKHGFLQHESEKAELFESFLYEKKFSKEKREKLADKGLAMSDGSYPIESPKDLRNAIQSIGRAKDPAATKKHIKARAKALQMSHLIPKDWK